MIPLKNILFAATKVVEENFKKDVFIEDNNAQGFDGSCFFVQIVPITSEAFTKTSNLRSIMISIKYLQEKGESIVNLHDTLDKLEMIFARTLKVDGTYITITDQEANIYTDEVGRILDFMISLNFNDVTYGKYDGLPREEIEYEIMQELHMQFNELKTITRKGVE